MRLKKIAFPGGGPLVIVETQELIGITSFVKDAVNGKPERGNDCESEVAPAVFVRVQPYLNWISEKTGMKFE
jgi:secreted trypsin-like serine protease